MAVNRRSATFDPIVLSFLESMRVPAVISTLGKRGEPITSAVWFGVRDGEILVSTPRERPKARNVRADARVSLIVDTKERPYRGVAIEGQAEVIDDGDGTIIREIATRYLGPDLPPEMEERIAAANRVAIRIVPVRVRPWNLAAEA